MLVVLLLDGPGRREAGRGSAERVTPVLEDDVDGKRAVGGRKALGLGCDVELTIEG